MTVVSGCELILTLHCTFFLSFDMPRGIKGIMNSYDHSSNNLDFMLKKILLSYYESNVWKIHFLKLFKFNNVIVMRTKNLFLGH